MAAEWAPFPAFLLSTPGPVTKLLAHLGWAVGALEAENQEDTGRKCPCCGEFTWKPEEDLAVWPKVAPGIQTPAPQRQALLLCLGWSLGGSGALGAIPLLSTWGKR